MKCRVNTDDLGGALAAVRPAVGHERPFVRLEMKGDRLEVAADDLRLGVRATVGAWADEGDGVVMVAHRPLASLIGHSTETDTEILSEDPDVAIVRSTAEMTLPTADPDWFPQRPEPDGVEIDLDEDQWAAVRRLIPFASNDRGRPLYTGLWFTSEGVVATDDCQIGLLRIPFKDTAIVPAETLAAIREEGKISVMVGQRSVKLTHSDGLSVTSSSIAATPPPVLDKLGAGPTTIRVVVSELVAAMERCSLTARSIFGHGYKLSMAPHVDGVEVRSQPDPANPQGTTVEVVSATCDGFDFDVGLNSAGLTAALGLVGEDEVVMHLDGPMRPIIVHNDEAIGATMPMKATG